MAPVKGLHFSGVTGSYSNYGEDGFQQLMKNK